MGRAVLFNRYIVECKYADNSTAGFRCIVFNRYIVECKYFFLTSALLKHNNLIDTLWNVNESISNIEGEYAI